jgi:hypothetical protein
MGIDTGCKDRYTMNFTKQEQTLLRRVMREPRAGRRAGQFATDRGVPTVQ